MTDNFEQLKENALKFGLVPYIIKSQTEQTGLKADKLLYKIETISNIMFQSVKDGLKSEKLSKSGLVGMNTSILSSFSHEMVSPFLKKAMLYSLAIIEQNARMGKIAACPTAGSSGIVPSVLIAAYEVFSFTKEDFINALIVAGEIGRIISTKVPPAGAVAGCQAECGTASAMSASSLAFLFNKDIDVILNAASLSLKNVLGLVCDPVAGLVEIPCVKRNPLLVSHSISSAYLALSGIKSQIPIDDVVDSMREIGNLMSPKLKESSEAGLATSKCAFSINNSLNKLWHA